MGEKGKLMVSSSMLCHIFQHFFHDITSKGEDLMENVAKITSDRKKLTDFLLNERKSRNFAYIHVP